MKAGKKHTTKRKGQVDGSRVDGSQDGKKKAVGGRGRGLVASIDKKFVNNRKKTVIRGRFVKGQSGNPNGRPKGSTNKISINEFIQAIHNIEDRKAKGRKQRITFLEKWVESAWGKPNAMAKIANFIMPTLKSIEQSTLFVESRSGIELKKLREKYAERFD